MGTDERPEIEMVTQPWALRLTPNELTVLRSFAVEPECNPELAALIAKAADFIDLAERRLPTLLATPIPPDPFTAVKALPEWRELVDAMNEPFRWSILNERKLRHDLPHVHALIEAARSLVAVVGRTVPCEACEGRGYGDNYNVAAERCRSCDGSGRVAAVEHPEPIDDTPHPGTEGRT